MSNDRLRERDGRELVVDLDFDETVPAIRPYNGRD